MDPQNQPAATPTPPVIVQPVTNPVATPQPIQPTPAAIRYAGVGRLSASLIDGITAIIIGLLPALLLANNFVHDNPTDLIAYTLNFVSILYNIFFVTRFGATPGKMLLKMKVVDHNYVKPSFGRVILRELIGKWVTAVFLLISGLFIIFDKQKRSLHDLIASTYVVYK